MGKNQTLAIMGIGVLVCTFVGLFLTGVVVRAMVLNNSFPFELSLGEAKDTPVPLDVNALAEAQNNGLITTIVPEPETTSVVSSGTGNLPAGQINIALLGVDDYGEGNFRTDVIMILSLDPSHNTTTLISFPRDLYVTIPACGENRINTAWVCGGFQSLQATFENNFGFKPDYYAMVNFNAFEAVVNSIDGIDVDVTQHFEDGCYFNQKNWCVLEPGIMHMDGEWALWYSRARYSTSDFDRNRRAQDVISAIAKKALNLNMLTKVPELYGLYREYVDTNLPLTVVLSNLDRFRDLTNMDNLRRYAVTSEMTVDWFIASGAEVLMPDYSLIGPMLTEALYRSTQ
ncbi:MAG TPA: LCP family protein [Anaerolineaceae bacterium]|nr:LCP family protein [Anaerolineaceae bacterium]